MHSPGSPGQKRIPRIMGWYLAAIMLVACAATGSELPKCNLALVLSGGGARGLAQIGVLKALHEAGVQPDLIVGTSMGAFVGALYCSGYSPDSIASIARSADWGTIFSNDAPRKTLFVSQKQEPVTHLIELRFDSNLKPVLPQSISHGQQFFDRLCPLLGAAQFHTRGDFSRLHPPLQVVTTDIVSGATVVLTGGSLARAIRASSGIPLAFSPLVHDSMLLMDGGLTANIPVGTARDDGCGFVLAVDVTSPLWGRDQLDNPIRMVDQLIAIGINRRKERERTLADLLVTPQLDGFMNTGFDQIDTIIDRGYRAMLDQLKHIPPSFIQHPGSTIQSTAPQPTVDWIATDSALAMSTDSVFSLLCQNGERPDSIVLALALRTAGPLHNRPFAHLVSFVGDSVHIAAQATEGLIGSLSIRGNTRTSSRKLFAALRLKPGLPLTNSTIEEVIGMLYSTQLFNTVEAHVDSAMQIVVSVAEKNHLRLRGGLRFDQFHLGEGFIEPAYENLFGRGIGLAFQLQYGLRREKYAIELQGNQIISPWWANNLVTMAYVGRERIVDERFTIEYPDSTDSLIVKRNISYNAASIHKFGIMGQVGLQVGQFSMLSGGVRLEQYETYRTNAPLTYDPGTFGEGLRALIATLTIDNLDRYPFPLNGHRHRFSVTAATDLLGGSAEFIRVDGYASYYHTMGKRHTIMPELHLAWANDTLPAGDRVQLGGAPTEESYKSAGVYNHVAFAGLAPRSFSGDMLALAHLGYRARLFKNLYLSAGVDWGAVWLYSPSPHLWPLAREQLRHAPLGLRFGAEYATLVGPLRVSWGRIVANPPSTKYGRYPGVFSFSAGHDF